MTLANLIDNLFFELTKKKLIVLNETTTFKFIGTGFGGYVLQSYSQKKHNIINNYLCFISHIV